jgi:hypothetical protein
MKITRAAIAPGLAVLAAAALISVWSQPASAVGTRFRIQNVATGTCISRALTVETCSAEDTIFLVTHTSDNSTILRNVRSGLCLGKTKSVIPRPANFACDASNVNQQWEQHIGSVGAIFETGALFGSCLGVSGSNLTIQSCDSTTLAMQWQGLPG